LLNSKKQSIGLKNYMREISPAYDMSSDDFLTRVPSKFIPLVNTIRNQKQANERPLPSKDLIDFSDLLTSEIRHKLIDKVALLVDENLFGRAEMCRQFDVLLSRALQSLSLQSQPVSGTAIYYIDGKEIFRWDHAWVRIGNEVIDANVDILEENPVVPKALQIRPYWGPVVKIPKDRMLRQNRSQRLQEDSDVDNIWWPDLLDFINTEL
jgi:hypothetical protein